MWAARDKNKELNFFKFKPIKVNEHWDYASEDLKKNYSIRPAVGYWFKEVTWETEPLEIDDLFCKIDLWNPLKQN